jgi:hypothetical protein
MDRVVRKHYDRKPLKLRNYNPSFSPNHSGRSSNHSNRSRSRDEYYNDMRNRSSRSGSRRKDCEISFEEKFKQHMERRLGMKGKKGKRKSTSKANKAGRKSKSRKASSRNKFSGTRKVLKPIPAPNVKKS